MTYDEFSDKLRKIKAEFLREHGRPLDTVEELESVLARSLARPKGRGLRSIRGIIP